ncbi:hypothetical protein F5890DRAFT_1420172 [Lentinula detonsa]|uniref:HAT C-terminal dimerisation domain-containing protein n=1 Tax=Lentinula detonsa TaxID=2804962 RepID=A0AA38PR03_9AGAR|nr:hypothetical protein F5890DRAFT_1420172 [Lentinula detonsa]
MTLEELDKALDEVGLMLILDVRTCWTSTHQMLCHALHNRKAIDQYIVSNASDLSTAKLTDSDWTALESIKNWLSEFRTATTEMLTTKNPMLSQTHLVFRGLQQSIKSIIMSLPANANATLKTALVRTHKKLSNYYFKFDVCPYYLWAALLDPRIGNTLLEKEFEDDWGLLSELKEAKDALRQEYSTHYAPPLDTTASFTQPGTFSSSKLSLPHSLAKPSFLSRLTTISHLLFSGSAVAVERVFSGGRDTIALRRASLKPETIRTLMLLKAQLRIARKQVNEILDDSEQIGLKA